MKLQLTVVCF